MNLASGETKLLVSLVSRLGEQIAVTRFDDPLVQQNVQALVKLSEHKVSTTAGSLAALLENLARGGPSDVSGLAHLRMQLFVLQTLGKCLEHNLECYRASLDASKTTAYVNYSHTGETTEAHALKILVDPPALDEQLVKTLASICSRYLQVTPDGAPLADDLYKAASTVLSYISAANFPVFFARFKARTAALAGVNDETPEMWDVEVLQYANINQRRLSDILQELTNHCRNFKRGVLTTVATVLRKTIWNWIHNYPTEFVALCQSQRRMPGGPDVLFDIFDSLADSNKKKTVFWPVQTMLLILCPDILLSITLREGNMAVASSKAAFLSNLKKSLKTKQLADVAAVSYVDICKASTFVSKADKTSALRHIVPEIENELKDRLFDISHPFANSDGEIDQQLMIDCLVACFRLNARNVIWSLFPICLDAEAPHVFKRVLLKSCLQIAADENRLPWNPTLAATHANLASPLRRLFQEYLAKDRNDRRPVDKATKKKTAEEAKVELEIQLNILELYNIDPQLALFNTDSKTQRDESRSVICGLTLCMQDPNLRSVAMQTLLNFHQPQYIEQWGPPELKMQTFWETSSLVLHALARQIMEKDEHDASVRYLVEIVREILRRRNTFLRMHTETASVGTDVAERGPASAALEAALLVLLCSSDSDIANLSAACLSELCVEAELANELDDAHPVLSVVDNLDVYRELASVGVGAAGRAALQKRIRKLLRQMVVQTAGNWNAWQEAYRRWAPLIQAAATGAGGDGPGDASERKSKIAISSLKSTSGGTVRATAVQGAGGGDDKVEWQNYTGFLAALGGVSIPTTAMEKAQMEATAAAISRDSGIGSVRHAGPTTQVLNTPMHQVLRFIEELLDYLVCDSVVVREAVREMVGIELSSHLFAMLFSSLRLRTDVSFSSDGEVIGSERNTLFIDQAVSVTRAVLERLTPGMEGMTAIDLETLILLFAKYLSRMGRSLSILRIRIKLCQMIEVLMTRREAVTFRQEIKFRNKLLELIVDWTSDFSRSDVDKPDEQKERLSRDLDLACMRAIVALLHQLPLQPADIATGESDNNVGLSEAKANLFYKYFGFLTKVMNRCRVLDNIDRTTQSGKMSKGLHELLQKSKDAVKDLGPLRDAAILAMSNLLSANIESGLKYSLGMGYNEDPKTRTAFMHVLTNILNQGTEFGELAEDAIQDRYARLVDLLIEPNMTIALALCDVAPVADADDLAPLLVATFDAHDRVLPLLTGAIEREVLRTDAAPSLFRRNSMATKLLSAFYKTSGFEYLTSTLMPVMTRMRAESESYEVDPLKIKPGEDINANMARLREMSQLFLDAIIESAPRMPDSIRHMAYAVHQIVGRRFPEAATLAVGGVIMLRFFSPAIVAPDFYGLVKDMSPKDPRRRGLVLITKVIQNVANRVEFGTKESFLNPLNPLLIDYFGRVDAFLLSISSTPPAETATTPAAPAVTARTGSATAPTPARNSAAHLEEGDLARLHWHLSENLERIVREFSSFARKPSSVAGAAPDTGAANGASIKRALDTLNNLLAQLGPPPDRHGKGKTVSQTSKVSGTNQLYHEFMTRNEKRNVDSIKERKIFFAAGQSKERRPVHYFIARKYTAAQVDEELLIFYTLQTLKPSTGKPFDLVVDATQFTPENQIPAQWLLQFMQLLPYDTVQNVGAIYIYNPNNAFKKWAKRLSSMMTSKIQKKIVFVATVAEFAEFIAPTELQLPRSTLALETDVAAKGLTFSPVNKVSHYYSHVPVVVKVGAETIHVTTVKRTELFGIPTILNDVFHIMDVDEVSVSARSDDASGQLVIKYDRGTSTVTLQSPRNQEIAQAIKAAKARFQASRPSEVSTRVIRPKDVPGTLLNMALLNMGSDDPTLRLAAYNLLYALSITFNFDVGNQLIEARGLCIPANNTSYVIGIAHKLSATEPQLTLEFLSEALVGFKRSSMELKHLALEYMAPWLNNLAPFVAPSGASDYKETRAKTEEIVRQLLEITVVESEMYPSLQSKVWYTIASVPAMSTLALDNFIKYALHHQVASREAEIMADSAVTLASVRVELIAGRIIASLRRAIERSAVNPVASLPQHPAWDEITVLLRFVLMLSFNNRLNVQQYLPELFHCISLVVATGSTLVRTSVHGVLINIVQSLCTSSPLSEDSLKTLTLMLSLYSEPKFRLLFGISRAANHAFFLPDATDDKGEKVPLASIETIVNSLIDVLTSSATSPDVAATWSARWMSLVTTTAFTPNPAIQARAFVVLGCLSSHHKRHDELLLFQVLVTLVDALQSFQEEDTELLNAILMCLTRMVVHTPTASRFLRSLFWIALSIIQIAHAEVMTAALDLLEVVLRTLDSKGYFSDANAPLFLMQARIPLEAICRHMDQLVGLHFHTNFGFAVAGNLLRGLKHPLTKTATMRVLTTFLEVTHARACDGAKISPMVTGLLAPLLPVTDLFETRTVLWLAGLQDLPSESDADALSQLKYTGLFERFELPDETTAVLLVALMSTMLQHADNEMEQLFIYRLLAEAAVAMPDVFAMIQDSIVPKMTQVVGQSQNGKVIDAVEQIMYTMVAVRSAAAAAPGAVKPARRMQLTYLTEIGFAGLSDCGSFTHVTKARKKQAATLASQLLQIVLK